MDTIFQALGHSSRRKILDVRKASPGSSVGDVCTHFDMSRVGVMKHLRLLEEAGLVISEKRGRVRRLYLNVAPIQLIHDRWTTEYSRFWGAEMTRVKYAAEQAAASSPPNPAGGDADPSHPPDHEGDQP